MELDRLERLCEYIYHWGEPQPEQLVEIMLDLIKEIKEIRKELENVRREQLSIL